MNQQGKWHHIYICRGLYQLLIIVQSVKGTRQKNYLLTRTISNHVLMGEALHTQCSKILLLLNLS